MSSGHPSSCSASRRLERRVSPPPIPSTSTTCPTPTVSLAAALWSAGAFLVYRLVGRRGPAGKAATVAALAVFSHWVLDFLVHRPDLPLYDNTAKVGLGLWNVPAVAFGLEATLLFGGMWLYFDGAAVPPASMVVFGLVMLGVQASYRLWATPGVGRCRGADRLGFVCRVRSRCGATGAVATYT